MYQLEADLGGLQAAQHTRDDQGSSCEICRPITALIENSKSPSVIHTIRETNNTNSSKGREIKLLIREKFLNLITTTKQQLKTGRATAAEDRQRIGGSGEDEDRRFGWRQRRTAAAVETATVAEGRLEDRRGQQEKEDGRLRRRKEKDPASWNRQQAEEEK